jgi:hypothetical protein
MNDDDEEEQQNEKKKHRGSIERISIRYKSSRKRAFQPPPPANI